MWHEKKAKKKLGIRNR